jgi:methylated-DNA-[protein]-cysteine S-methyltransferase
MSLIEDEKIEISNNLDEFGIKIQTSLMDYFDGKLQVFELPLAFDFGTEFQKSVWKALLEIPYGKTTTYSEIAKKIGNPKAFQAVGGAVGDNPIAIIIPCHRVIGKNGSLTGFRWGLDRKIKLLKLENRDFNAK